MTDQDPFAGGESTPSLSFKDAALGTTYTGTVLELPELVQSRDFETGELAYWPPNPGQAQGNPKMAAVVKIACDQTADERAIWAVRPSAMFAAIKAAQEASGQIRVGTKITVSYVADKPNQNPRLSPAKQYTVTLVQGDAFADTPGETTAQAEPASPAAVASIVARPESIPESVWATLDADAKIALAAVHS